MNRQEWNIVACWVVALYLLVVVGAILDGKRVQKKLENCQVLQKAE